MRFIGHTGEIKALNRLSEKCMFVLDANTVQKFLQHSDRNVRLDEESYKLLQITRRRVRQQWTVKELFIPVEPVLALMELTRQDYELDFDKYLKKFQNFFFSVYGINNYDPTWVKQVYDPVSRLVSSMHQSLFKTIEKITDLAPATGTLKEKDVLKNIDKFLKWVASEKDNLEVIGGPLLYLAVYAIAGSPEAHRFLKLQQVQSKGKEIIARNVAWDLMHWVNLDFHYHYAKYPSTIVCTSDISLADFLLIRTNSGPRIGKSAMLNRDVIVSYGNIIFPKLSRIDQTKLGSYITEKLLDFWDELFNSNPNDAIWVGPFRKSQKP